MVLDEINALCLRCLTPCCQRLKNGKRRLASWKQPLPRTSSSLHPSLPLTERVVGPHIPSPVIVPSISPFPSSVSSFLSWLFSSLFLSLLVSFSLRFRSSPSSLLSYNLLFPLVLSSSSFLFCFSFTCTRPEPTLYFYQNSYSGLSSPLQTSRCLVPSNGWC